MIPSHTNTPHSLTGPSLCSSAAGWFIRQPTPRKDSDFQRLELNHGHQGCAHPTRALPALSAFGVWCCAPASVPLAPCSLKPSAPAPHGPQHERVLDCLRPTVMRMRRSFHRRLLHHRSRHRHGHRHGRRHGHIMAYRRSLCQCHHGFFRLRRRRS
jgi:hypothetical protein